MFEITKDDIASLNEEDLRELVGRLCEADLQNRNLSTAAVTRGGHQNAGDGGIDVRVNADAAVAFDDFIPRASSGFQVKRTDMPANAIVEEMRPAGVVRPAIIELAKASGAYVMVSSLGSVADFALKNRIEAMSAALKDVPNAASLKIDFYDRVRLTSWAQRYPSIAPWIRERVGKPISGWQSFGSWTVGEKHNDEYLLENTLRIKTARQKDGEGFSPDEGINQIRQILRQPSGVVRLVGLSGVGKTRLAQALFDERVAQGALAKESAAYTNVADSPDPPPLALISRLIQENKRAVVVVDNCPPDLHARIAETCNATESTVSALTIEYDIREDEPEGTSVFHLEPASADLIERLVRIRRPDISQVDAATVAEFSGGNARIAFALVKTIELNGTVAGLKEEQLFQRLFQQRHEYDADLLRVAAACSTVYSFDGEDVSDENTELAILGRLAGIHANEVFRNISELVERDLVQVRGRWRAVLPHAIANRLASKAIKNIPFQTIRAELIDGRSSRLRKSFSRRLSYLHDSTEAIRIVEEWLSPGGLLSDVAGLDDIGCSMFDNAAPVLPNLALRALEISLRSHTDENASRFPRFINLVRAIAFDAALFERCVEALTVIGQIAPDNRKRVSDTISSLFLIYLSGTHATISQRTKVIAKLVQSQDDFRRHLGFESLRALLEATHFYSDHFFDFGSRSRDYGYWPRTDAEVRQWFVQALALVDMLVLDPTVGTTARAILTAQLRGIWTRTTRQSELITICTKISSSMFWPEGWNAIRQIRKFDADEMSAEALARLSELEQVLKPNDLAKRVKSMVFMTHGSHDYEDDSSTDIRTAMKRTEAVAHQLGKEVAENLQVFEELLPELLTSSGNTPAFGRGLAKKTKKPEVMWHSLITQLRQTAESLRREGVLCGFIFALKHRNPALCAKLLDEAVEDERTSKVFPILQTAAGLDKAGVDRLRRSIALAKAPISTFEILSIGRATDSVEVMDLCELLMLVDEAGGNDTAIHVLAMYLVSNRTNVDLAILETGRKLLRRFPFAGKGSMLDHYTAILISVCLIDADGAAVADELTTKFKAACSNLETRASSFFDVLTALIGVQPGVVLSSLLEGDDNTKKKNMRLIQTITRQRESPFEKIDVDAVLNWCSVGPGTRYEAVARVVKYAEQGGESGPRYWTSLASQLMARAPDRAAVLAAFAERFRPTSGWNSSLVPILERHFKLLDALDSAGDEPFAASIALQRKNLSIAIEEQKKLEQSIQRRRDETFE